MTSGDWYSAYNMEDRERDDAPDAPLQLDAGRGKDTGTLRFRETNWIVGSDADTTDGLKGLRKGPQELRKGPQELRKGPRRQGCCRQRTDAMICSGKGNLTVALFLCLRFIAAVGGQIDSHLIELLELLQIRPCARLPRCLLFVGIVVQVPEPRIRQQHPRRCLTECLQ